MYKLGPVASHWHFSVYVEMKAHDEAHSGLSSKDF